MSLSFWQRHKPEPICLVTRRHNYFPKQFVWRGHQYDVYAVAEAWTEIQAQGARHYFRVHCQEGTFDLCQDATINAWYLAKQIN